MRYKIARSLFRCFIPSFVLAAAFSLFLSATVSAQTIRHTENSLDQTMRSNLNVDPSTLNMSFSVTLGNYPGRQVNLPVTLNYSFKVWRIMNTITVQGPLGIYTHTRPMFGEHSVAGWTTTLDEPYYEYTPQAYDSSGYAQCTDCDGYEYAYWVERVTLHLPGGIAHELRKSDDSPIYRTSTQGAPAMNGTYVAVDGSRLKFDASASPNVIYMPDGSRYLLHSTGAEFVDPNGNKLTYSKSSKQWTDTLGRTIGFALDNSSTSAPQSINLPAVGTANMTFQLEWKNLSNALSSGSVQYRGSLICQPPYNGLSPALFVSPSSQERICGDASSSTTGVPFDPVVLRKIILPNGREYVFSYNVYGEIDKITLPTGGYQRYVYAQIEPLDSDHNSDLHRKTNRGVVSHYVSATGQSADEKEWQYAVTTPSGKYVVSVTAPNSVKTERELIRSAGSAGYSFDDARAGRASEERIYTAASQMWRRTLTDWDKTSSGSYGSTRDPRPIKQVEILLDTGGDAQTKMATMAYDSDLNVIETKSHDYTTVTSTTGQTAAIGSFSAGTLLREDEATFFLSDSDFSGSWTSYRNRHLLALPTKQFVKNGSGTIVAATKIGYDERSLSTYGGTIPGWTNPSTTVRGNPTTVERWQNFNGTSFDTHPSGSFLTTKSDYDQLGNVVKITDANNKETVIVYTDNFSDSTSRDSYAYPTRTDTPVPDSSGYYASSTALQSHTTYDLQTGKITKTKDANNKETTYAYLGASNLNRLDKVTLPDGGETSYEYNDNPDSPTTNNPGNLYIWQKTKQDSGGTLIEDRAYFDRLGRPWRSAHKESSTQWSVKDTKYDDLSRVSQTSNPYFLTTITDPPTTSSIWTTMTYDALSRVLTVTTPDSAVVTTAYSGNQVTVTDQAGKVRRSVTDGLGRLKQVVEDPSGLNYTTNYSYSTPGELIKVEQGTQYRYFLYDSLSRLIRAKNPEQDANSNLALTPPSDQSTGNTAWALKYVYDANGNLTSKVDARNVTTSYGYDALNRNVAVSYNDGVTPAIERYYDKHPNASQNGRGRLYYNVVYRYEGGNPAFLRTILDQYDAMGRPQTQIQSFYSHSGGVWQDYTTTMSYDLAGHPTGEGYPSSRSVATTYSLSGRISGLSTSGTTLLSEMSYEAFGGLASEKYAAGNNLIHAMSYNNRLQPSEIKLGTSGTSDSIFKLNYIYGTVSNPNDADGSILTGQNNGNVGRIKYTIGGTLQYSQTYQYDGVNRLTYGVEHNNGTLNDANRAWYQTFAYDRWGNRGMTVASTSSNLNQGGNALQSADFSGSTNRISKTGYSYDNAGNLTAEPGSKAYSYDGENKMVTAVVSGVTSKYWYDADGRRVKKVVGSTATRFVYNASGQLIAEYDEGASSLTKEYVYRGGELAVTVASGAVNYATADHLGTPRVWTNSSGSVVTGGRHDYAPFGEELFASFGVRTIGANWPSTIQADGQRKQYTGYERDTESGLDFAMMRYFSNLNGRFTTTDDFWKDSDVADPQSWNKYIYVRNNPLKYVDQTGEKASVKIQTDEKNKSGVITITASIAIYSAGSDSLTEDQLKQAAAAIKSSIESSWSGQFEKDGITYTVNTSIDVQVFGGKGDATKSGAQNVIGIGSGDSIPGKAISHVDERGLFTRDSAPDTGTWRLDRVLGGGQAAHEFTHLLGGDNTTNRANVSFSPYIGDLEQVSKYGKATGFDFRHAIGQSIDDHRRSSRQRMLDPTRELGKGPQTVLGPPRNHTTSRVLHR
jgi:RHS repeat-associated protein